MAVLIAEPQEMGIYEKNITLDISKRVETLLKNKGYVVKMTRNSDDTVSLQDRVEISEEFAPDIFVKYSCEFQQQ